MGLKLNTASSGSVTLEPTNTSSNYTLTVPAQTGTIATTVDAGNYYAFKNRIINGNMAIDQRNAGASGTGTNNFPVDRWMAEASQSGKWTWGQNLGSVTPPNGFKNYMGFSSSSAYSLGANDYFLVTHKIEGYNVADLNFGASGASSFTLSFWVRSSLTGTFSGSLMNSNQSRCYIFTYSVNSANTWEQKTITVAGDTSGTWQSTNDTGLSIRFSLGVGSTFSTSATNSWVSSQVWSVTGSTSVVGTNGATFYITGVQLEKGSVVTSFDYRPYGTELALCQRYYEKMADTYYNNAFAYAATQYESVIRFLVEKRATPSIANSGTFQFNGSGINTTASALGADIPTTKSVLMYKGGLSGFSQGVAMRLMNGTNSYIEISAEL